MYIIRFTDSAGNKQKIEWPDPAKVWPPLDDNLRCQLKRARDIIVEVPKGVDNPSSSSLMMKELRSYPAFKGKIARK